MADQFQLAMREVAYLSMLKVNPGIIDALKDMLNAGATAKKIEKHIGFKFSNDGMTRNTAILAAYHMQANPELLK